MDALYDENFSLLNEDRISVLSYLAGVHLILNTKPNRYDPSCPEKVNVSAAYITADAVATGHEHKAGAISVEAGLDKTMQMLGTDALGYGVRTGLWGDGAHDAKFLLKDYGGCSGPTFNRIYSSIQRFVFNNGPAFRDANATPVLKLEISGPYVDRFWTEQTGKPYLEFTVCVTNYEDLPRDMFSRVDSPTSGEIFAGDARILAGSREIWTPHDLTRLVFNAPKGELPEKAYLILYDRKHDKVYRSAVVAVPTSAVASAPAVQTQPPPRRKKN